MKSKVILFLAIISLSLSIKGQNIFTIDIQYGENVDINPLVYGNHFSRLFDRCRCYDPWSPEPPVDSINQCMDYIASIQSKVIRYPSGGDNKWMHASSDSVGYGFLQSDLDTLLALAIIDTGTWETQSAEVAEQYALNPDGARYIDRLIDLIEFCDSVNGFAPGVIFVANVTMSAWLPDIYNVVDENIAAIEYLRANGVDVVGIEMGSEHYDDESLFPTFNSYWLHVKPLLDALQADGDLNSIPVSLTAAPEPDFAQLFGYSPDKVSRFKTWNTGLNNKSTNPKFDAYSVHIYNTARMMEPCYQRYTDNYYNLDPDFGIIPGINDTALVGSWQCALDSFENFANTWLDYIFDHYTIIDDSSYRLGTTKRYWVTEWGVKPAKDDRDPSDTTALFGNFNNTFTEAAFTMEYLLNLLELQGAGSGVIDIEFATKHNTMSGFTYGLTSYRGQLDPIDEWYYKRSSYYPFVINENIFSASYERVNCSPVLLDGSYIPYTRGFFNEGSGLFYLCFVNGLDETVDFAIHDMTGDTTALGYGSLTPSSSYGCYLKYITATQLYDHAGTNQYMIDNAFYNDTTVAPLIDTIYFSYFSTGFPDSLVSLPPYSLGWIKWQVSPKPNRLVDTFASLEIITWPNPATNVVNFSISSEIIIESGYTLNIYNMFGEKIDKIEFNSAKTEWDCENSAKGIYIYELLNQENSRGTGKIILQ